MGKLLKAHEAAFTQAAKTVVTESVLGLMKGFVNRLKAKSSVAKEQALETIITESAIYFDIVTQQDQQASQQGANEIKNMLDKLAAKWNELKAKITEGAKNVSEPTQQKINEFIEDTEREFNLAKDMASEKSLDVLAEKLGDKLNMLESKVKALENFLKDIGEFRYVEVKKYFKDFVETVQDAKGQVTTVIAQKPVAEITFGFKSDLNPENWKMVLAQYDAYLKKIAEVAQKEKYGLVKVNFIDKDGSVISVTVDPKTLAQEAKFQASFIEKLKMTLEKIIAEIQDFYAQASAKVKGLIESKDATTIAIVVAFMVAVVGLGFVLYKFAAAKEGSAKPASEFLNLVFVEYALKTDLNTIAAVLAYQATFVTEQKAAKVVKGAALGILIVAFIIAALLGFAIIALLIASFTVAIWAVIAGKEEVVQRFIEAHVKSPAEANFIDMILKTLTDIAEAQMQHPEFAASINLLTLIFGAIGTVTTLRSIGKLIAKVKKDLTQSGGMPEVAKKRLAKYAEAAGFGGVYVKM